MTDIMVDLETLSTDSNAFIVSIGACRFDKTGPLEGTFYHTIDMRSAQLGAHIDPATVAWWMSQNPQAKQVFKSEDSLPFLQTLQTFAAWVGEPRTARVWGNGAVFDNVVLGNAFARTGGAVAKPWQYWNDRCYRTLRDMFPHIEPVPFQGTPHHALHDALHQARHCAKILAHIS